MLKKMVLTLSFALGAVSAYAGNAFWLSGRVLSPATTGNGADASLFAGVTLLREQIPGEKAVQLASSDTLFPTRVMLRPGQGAYFLTDAGSQWPSAVASGQVVLCVAETYLGQHAWQGKAYASASSGTLVKPDLIQGLASVPDQELAQIPEVELLNADSTQITLKIYSFKDLSGLASGYALWRRPLGTTTWVHLGMLSIPVAGTETTYADTSVQAGQLYEYGLSVNYIWKGGSGQGRLPQIPEIYSTLAMSVSVLMAANSVQPTPTSAVPDNGPTSTPVALPDGWIAYPNPVIGSKFWVTIEVKNTGILSILTYTLDGTLALSNNTKIEQIGRNKVMIEIPKLAPGIYLLKAKLRSEDGDETMYPLRKLAIVK